MNRSSALPVDQESGCTPHSPSGAKMGDGAAPRRKRPSLDHALLIETMTDTPTLIAEGD